MRKSEMIRAALGRVRRLGKDRRVCYCTPNRQMLLSIDTVALNNVHGNYSTAADRAEVAEDLKATVAHHLREVTNRMENEETLRDFDTEDTQAAYSLTDDIVEEAFEKAAVAYEEQGD
jgi:hypothetical protein